MRELGRDKVMREDFLLALYVDFFINYFKISFATSKTNEMKFLKMMKKCFLFHLKSSFRSQDI